MAANMVIDQGAAPDEAQYGDGQPQLDKFRLRWELARLPALEPPAGEVSFDDKRAPTEQGHALSTGTFCFLRGRSDVSRLKARLERDDDFVWSDAYASEHNVTLARPSHDGWGIRKLAFVFCDDFLHRVYRLPLWEDPSWRALIDPILESCGVPRERIIRCLLASMPPRTVIPPHHDSGYWVPRSRRLHCAIKTNPDVVFLAGRTLDEMHRIAFKEGCVVELNNQAKHYVANLSDQYRTHLIFDYVDDRAEPYLLPPQMPVVQLSTGDELLQTRRSVALASERGSGPRAPHILIIGAQKAGTTSMFEYLSQHPLIKRGVRRETHFLDWRWPGDDDPDSLSKKWHETFFDAEAHALHPDLRALDSTPSYLLQSNLAIPRLQRMGKDLPLIVMVRDPALRAVSHHAMIADKAATPQQRRSRGTAWLGKSVREVAEAELVELLRAGVLRCVSGDGLGGDYEVDDAAFRDYVTRLPIGHGAHSLLLRGFYAAQLRPWREAFGAERILVLRCEDMVTSEGAAAAVALAQRHAGLREHPLDDARPRNARSYAGPPDDLVEDLRRFFSRANADLYEMLGWGDGERW